MEVAIGLTYEKAKAEDAVAFPGRISSQRQSPLFHLTECVRDSKVNYMIRYRICRYYCI